MASPPNCSASTPVSAPPAHDSVDPFLKESLQNPRHRLTILRMELDIQRFMRNPDQNEFEFQHYPASYLRLAAHKVAQHYGLHFMASDTGSDGSGSRVVVRKTMDSKLPPICLSEIGSQHPDNEKHDTFKIAIRPKPGGSVGNGTEVGIKHCTVRTAEERKEEYDRARARIFSSSTTSDMESPSCEAPDSRSLSSSKDETGSGRASTNEAEKISPKGRSTQRVAILRDREKDRSDPDYDRSYDRYVKSHAPNLDMGEFAMHQSPFLPYEITFPQFGYLPTTQTPVNYGVPSPLMSPFCAFGSNQNSRESNAYLHWPSPSLVYTHVQHTISQAPFHQQPLSSEYTPNH
ncbi:hypothetical protein ACLOJK_003546 [Asimina triloba]